MIKRGETEWVALMDKIKSITKKSNREVLCVKCW